MSRRPSMAASHFFIGVTAGVAILTIPTAVMVPQFDIPQRIGEWIAGPPADTAPRATTGEVAGLNRPRRGYVAGQPTPTAEPAPTIAPPPTPRPAPAARAVAPPPVEAVPTLPASGLQTGVVRSGGGGGVYVRRVAGIQSPSDAFLPDGSPILISASSEIQVSGQTWRSIRGLNGVSGWVPSSMLNADGAAARPPTQAAQPVDGQPAGERALITHTDGQGVGLRRSARLDDRLPSGLMEGTSVAILERSGSDWARVRADNGQEGWVPSQYLAPAAG